MWKVLIPLFLAHASLLADSGLTHLQELRKKYPYGLLTDDFGVLNSSDLRINSCIAEPQPFSEGDKSSSYPYWQCFDVMSSKMDCERGKYDSHEEARMSMLVLSTEGNGELHEFISRRPIPLSSCRLYQKNWLKLIHDEKHICISASDPSKRIVNGRVIWTWIFGRYKTPKGCDSYFQGECDNLKNCAN